MSDLKKFPMPDEVNTAKDLIEYVCAVYGIKDSQRGLLDAAFKELCYMAVATDFDYDGWFEDNYEEFLTKNIRY